MVHPRRRGASVLLALGLALLPTALVAPAALGQETPESAVNGVLDAVAAKDFERVGEFACEEQRDAVMAEFDLAAQFEAIPGIDVDALLDALTIRIEDRSVTLVSQDGDEALVAVRARMAGELDPEKAREFVVAILTMFGQDTSDEAVESTLADLQQEMTQGTDLESEVRVVRESGRWLVCDELSGSGEPMDEGASPSVDGTVESPICDLVSVEELNAVGPLKYDSSVAYSTDSCQWDADMETAFHSLAIYVEPYADISELKSVYADLQDVTVAGHPGATDGTLLWVATDKGVLNIFPSVFGDEVADLAAYATQVAEIVVPRWLEQ